MENKIKHLEMIQGVINRMALASKDTDKMYFLISYVPVIVFWFLDSYYLLQERLYRDLYNDVRKKSNSEIDFSLNAAGYAKKDYKRTLLGCVISKTELWFYLPLALICSCVIVITHI